ncbi:hypothetical protein SAMN05192574_12011 [Mucilaginibacter gossypiicola]|uniref:Uncharacterized protein n=1 Tax=Mucilaginibacter gossypiicola TaxID=551995 RepID=A0A1H8UNV7_9SPHI|nr:hypothetical protein SAMN05192574_12011 [Mucilaginibacter gossypiicola]
MEQVLFGWVKGWITCDYVHDYFVLYNDDFVFINTSFISFYYA